MIKPIVGLGIVTYVSIIPALERLRQEKEESKTNWTT
jgi:hypothetical protein